MFPLASVLHSVGESFLNFQVVAKRESEQRASLARAADVVVAVPYFDTDIYDLSGLVKLGTKVAIKEYYPGAFGSRDASLQGIRLPDKLLRGNALQFLFDDCNIGGSFTGIHLHHLQDQFLKPGQHRVAE